MQNTFLALKNLYENGMITNTKIENAVKKGLITAEEKAIIIKK